MATLDFDISTIINQTPLFDSQWYLQNTGKTGGTLGADANIIDAWSMATGEGVVIGIVDDGVQYTHPDLNDNYNYTLGYDFIDSDSDPFPYGDSEEHGTLVAGVAVGDGNNIGIIGAAPDASFASLRVDLSNSYSVLEDYNALSHNNQDIDIYNNSWIIESFLEPQPEVMSTLKSGVQEGREGKGSIYVFAAGNYGNEDDNINYHLLNNSRYTIAVGAIDHNGEQTLYSNPGSALLISGYGGDANARILTTQRTSNLYDYGYFGGTSAAAPLVSGVIALMLEANPDLTWRDVQHILVETAEKNDFDDSDWVQNGAGHDVNHKYGFGSIDATAAVNAASNWETVIEETSLTSEQININSSIPDYNLVGISSSFTFEEDIDIEWVEVSFDANHIYRGDLKIILTSPDGTKSVLAEVREDSGDHYNDWVFTSSRHWGESSQGEWTLTVSDEESGLTGTWNFWQINLYGTNNDNPPELINPIANLTVTEDSNNQTIDLSNAFEDVDGDEITFVVQANSNDKLVLSTIEDNNLILDFAENQSGITDITILATANGKTVDNEFTVIVESVDDAPELINPLVALTVKENDANQTIDLSNVFQDVDGDEITLAVQANSNDELVITTLEDNNLILDFVEDRSGTADITILATTNGKTVDDTFTVTVEPEKIEQPEQLEQTIKLFRFRNTTFDTGTYIFVGEAEKDFIRNDENLSNIFALDGVDSDGNINPAFVASTENGDDLIPFFRLESLTIPGTFLFVSTAEHDAIFAEDSNQKDQWKKQGFADEEETEDIAEFYLLDSSVDEGIQFNRFQNTQNNTFLYAGKAETEAIANNPNLVDLFVNQGNAFESFI